MGTRLTAVALTTVQIEARGPCRPIVAPTIKRKAKKTLTATSKIQRRVWAGCPGGVMAAAAAIYPRVAADRPTHEMIIVMYGRSVRCRFPEIRDVTAAGF